MQCFYLLYKAWIKNIFDVTFLKSNDIMNNDYYKIIPLKTGKDKIEQPDAVKNKIIAKFPSSILLVGKSGSGKSILCQNLIFDERFYGKKFWDEIYLVSPTAKSDDIQKQFNIDNDNIFDDLDTAPEKIEQVLRFQREYIEENGIEKALKIVILFDDVVSDPHFMKNNVLTKLFISCRHYNVHCVVCTQSFKSVPKRMRIQSNMICFFPSSSNEVEALSESYTPPHHTKKDFYKLVEYATNLPFNFLTILTTEPFQTRYRKNLSTILKLKK